MWGVANPESQTYMEGKIYFIATIDTECDKGPNWALQRPLKFRSVTEGIPLRLEPLFKQFGVNATYLLSPEVMLDDTCVCVLRKVNENGAELGTHLHGEFVQPCSRMDTDSTWWYMQSSYPESIEAEKMKNLTDLFEVKFDYRPLCFRAGRFGLGTNSLKILSDLGYQVDSSVAPFCRWKDRGGEVSFFGAPVSPYFPDVDNPLGMGNLAVLEVPITIGNSWWSYIPVPILKTVNKYPRLWFTALHRLKLIKKFNPVWLRPSWFSFEDMERLIRKYLRRNSTKARYLVMMFHSVEVIPGCSPSIQDESGVNVLLSRLQQILEFLVRQQATFITLSQAKRIFKDNLNSQHY